MKTAYLSVILCWMFICFTSCSEKAIDKISLEKLENSPAYLDASLTLLSPQDSIASGLEAVPFEFEVNNYELGAQTESPNAIKVE